MTNTVVVGTQWGDEGKAKIIDFLAKDYDVVVRFNGGANAGHTSEAMVDGEMLKFIFHLTPAGALYKDKDCLCGNGMVIEPIQLLDEIKELEEKGIKIRERLFISKNAHMVMPYHPLLDKLKDEAKGKGKIGTTGRGIGPTYTDKAQRVNIRVEDLLDKNKIRSKLENIVEEKNMLFDGYGKKQFHTYKITQDNIENIVDSYYDFGQQFKDKMVDPVYFLDEKRKQGKNILYEGAQATFLDLDHGTYPYVTSSNATAGGACTGSGTGPRNLDNIVGVLKAYTTRVGEGGFPTELGEYEITKEEKKATDDEISELEKKVNGGKASEQEIGQYIRAVGKEYGATTGRPRRCGWLDIVMAKKAAIVNSLDEFAITKLDVLDGLDEIKICVGYEIDGRRVDQFPTDASLLDKINPIYESMKGWKKNIRGITNYDELPEEAKAYLMRIEELTGVRVGYVSTGPERDQTIYRKAA